MCELLGCDDDLIEMTFSSMPAQKVVNFVTYGKVSDWHFVKMTTFPLRVSSIRVYSFCSEDS